MSNALVETPTRLKNIKELAEFLGVHRQTVKHWLRKAWVAPSMTYGPHPAFTPEDVEAIRRWYAARRVRPPREESPPLGPTAPAGGSATREGSR